MISPRPHQQLFKTINNSSSSMLLLLYAFTASLVPMQAVQHLVT
jgi:hypothetical protein